MKESRWATDRTSHPDLTGTYSSAKPTAQQLLEMAEMGKLTASLAMRTIKAMADLKRRTRDRATEMKWTEMKLISATLAARTRRGMTTKTSLSTSRTWAET